MKTLALLILTIATLVSFNLMADSPSTTAWTINDPFSQKVFIENNGQFTGIKNISTAEVKYGVDDGGTQIFFSATRLCYSMIKQEKNSLPDADEKPHREIPEPIQVQMEWIGSNQQVKIEAENEAASYNTYLDPFHVNGTIKANGFETLVYHNLYPGIDVIYRFHEKQGIKYSFILHPGADPSVIKMKYSGALNISVDQTGNLRIATDAGEIMDHAPQTFYEDHSLPIHSAFIRSGNEISFHLENYDHHKTVVIDPWTVSPAFIGANAGWDITRDNAGNIYCEGGAPPFYLKKFTSTGVLIWTFTYPNSTSWPGDFTTTNAGFTYISYGAWIGTNLTKIDPAGNVIFNNVSNNITYPNMEGWRITQDCKTGALYGAGFGYINSVYEATNLFSIDTSTGNFLNYVALYTSPVEVRSIVCAPATGAIYALALQASSTAVNEGNRIVKLDPSLASLFNVADGYSMMETQPDYYPNGYGGYNGIALGCYLYSSNGLTLKRWDKSTGIQIGSSVNIPAGSELFTGGLFVDKCGNVYAGSSNAVVKYDASLVQQSTAPTNGPVYDICIGITPGEILVCGQGFISSINMNVCTQPGVVVTKVDAAPCTCTGSATAIANGNCDTTAFSFLWQPTGGTGAVATGLCPGVYTVTLTDTSQCFGVSVIDTVTINGSLGGLSVSVQTTTSCGEPCNGSASVTANNGNPPYTYLWSNGSTASSLTNLCGGTYSATITDSAGCTHTESLTVAGSPSITISTMTSNATCQSNNGSIEISTSGGTLPLEYLWSNGLTTANIDALGPGDYSLLVSDSNGCSQSAVATVLMDSLPRLSFNSQIPQICSPQVIAFIPDSLGVVSFSWNFGDSTVSSESRPLHSYGAPGNYNVLMVAVTSDGCLDSVYQNVFVPAINTGVNISNAFSPNNDGVNDLAKPYINCSSSLNYTFSIFNRWGELLFDTHDPGFGWDGKYNGTEQPIGVYVYYIKYDCDNCSDFLKGNLTLIR